MTIWLIEPEAFAKLQAGASLQTPDTQVFSVGGIMRVSGGVASIAIDGILTPKPDRFLAWLFGANTAYSDIVDAIEAANSDQKVKKIRLAVGSTPGGDFEGLIPAMDAIRESLKPITAVVADAAQSGGYMLVSQAQEGVYAKHRATMFGSVGVAIRGFVIPEIVDITNTDSPDKRPDLGTKEGKTVIREQLDKIQTIITDTIADGRGVKTDDVKKNFGRGASFPAEDALEKGMIDGIGIPESSASTGKNGGKSMDLAELKATHPELVEAIKTKAINGERERVSAHLVLGDASGDMTRAVGDVKSGAAVTQETTAFHTAAAIKEAKKKARVADNPDLENTPTPPPEKTAEQIADEKISAAMNWADDPESTEVTQ